MSLSNLKNNLPPKVRVMMGVIVIMGIAAAFLTFSFVFSGLGESEEQQQRQQQSRVDMGATSADRARVGDEPIYDEGSPMAEQERQAREAQFERAQEEDGGGYMDPLDPEGHRSSRGESSSSDPMDFFDQLEQEAYDNARGKLDSERARGGLETGIDDTGAMSDRERAREQRIRDLEQALARANAGGNADGQGGLRYDEDGNPYYSNGRGNLRYDENGNPYYANEKRPFSDEESQQEIDSFVDDQLSQLGGSGGDGSAYADRYRAYPDGSYTGAMGSGSIGGEDSQQGQRAPGGGGQSQEDAYMDPYVANDRHQPQPDYDGLADIRDGVSQGMTGGSGGGGQGADRASGSGMGDRGAMGSSGGFQQTGGGFSQAESGGSGGNNDPDRPYKAIGDTCYARLKMGATSEAPTPVKAQILDRGCNEIFGSVLVAEPAVEGEYITLEFQGVNINGRTQSIDAIALNPDDDTAIFQDDINRHIMSRYGSLAIASAFPGWSEAVTDTEVSRDTQGGEQQSTGAVDALSDQIAVVTGAVGDAFVPAMQENFNRPPTIQVYNNRDILIMFMNDFHID